MENEQPQSVSGDPQNNKSSEKEERVGSASKEVRRKRQQQPTWRKQLSREGYSQEEIDSLYKRAMEKYEAAHPEKSKTSRDKLHIQLKRTLSFQPSPDPCVFGGWGTTYDLIIEESPERLLPQHRQGQFLQGRRDQLPSPNKRSSLAK